MSDKFKRGDVVKLKGLNSDETAVVKSLGPGTEMIVVRLDKPLGGYASWLDDELELVTKPGDRR